MGGVGEACAPLWPRCFFLFSGGGRDFEIPLRGLFFLQGHSVVGSAVEGLRRCGGRPDWPDAGGQGGRIYVLGVLAGRAPTVRTSVR